MARFELQVFEDGEGSDEGGSDDEGEGEGSGDESESDEEKEKPVAGPSGTVKQDEVDDEVRPVLGAEVLIVADLTYASGGS